MNLIFSEHASVDYMYWKRTSDKMLNRVNQLILDTELHPEKGLGKPEALRNGLFGYWSRRITDEHRFVYKVDGEDLKIVQLRYHY